MKPLRGCGSDLVFLCSSDSAVDACFEEISSAPMFGDLERRNGKVLMQEYVEGTEYAVDTVSRSGSHKVVAVWEYVKKAVKPEYGGGAAEGGDFVYFKTQLIPPSHPYFEDVCEVTTKALDILHQEVSQC